MDTTLLSQHILLHDLVLYTWLMYFFTDQAQEIIHGLLLAFNSSHNMARRLFQNYL